jgi:hypothetical protein
MRITFAVSVLSATLMISSSLHAADEPENTMQIARNGEQPSVLGSSSNFVGTVRVDPLFAARPPSRVTAGAVTFQPGARSAWHTHPAGQNLIVTAGVGWIQQEGGGENRHQAWRCDLDTSGCKALAWGHELQRLDAFGNSRGTGREKCRVAGTGY